MAELGNEVGGNSVGTRVGYGIIAGPSFSLHAEQMGITMSEVIYA